MFSHLMNQSFTLKTKSSVDKYNQGTYTTSTITGRFEYKRKQVKSVTNQDIISEARVFTNTSVNIDDIITWDSKDWRVISVSICYDLFGSVSHYQVYL